mmetsp:Transcript_17054/g.53613  ORF Transcript_17054/g.53613 Transcript_17054/m.53613 type:complete len:413 (+) Transcript_17054:61-1299(+)
MRITKHMMLLSSTAACANAFLSTSTRRHTGITADIPAALRAPAVPVGAVGLSAPRAEGTEHSGLGGLLMGAVAAGAALLRLRRGRRTTTTRGAERQSTAARDNRMHILLKRYAKKVGRQRYFKQQEILRESGITAAKGGYKKWYPNRHLFNQYKGPESHPNNPYFPAASPGYKRTPEAVRGWAPALVSATSAASSLQSTFAGGSSKRFWHANSSRVSGSALVLHAHKKTSASTKNQGHSLRPHFWGITKHGYQGCAVKAGTRLLKQKGMNWYAGKNVARARDYSLIALRDGIVQWRGIYRHREVCVIPWEYVREKCTWINPNTLGPKEYEPWMGTREHNKRQYILQLRREWLSSPAGKEWSQKKKEKQEKQKVIQKKIRTYLTAKRRGRMAEKEGAADPVAAGGESESEAEA